MEEIVHSDKELLLYLNGLDHRDLIPFDLYDQAIGVDTFIPFIIVSGL